MIHAPTCRWRGCVLARQHRGRHWSRRDAEAAVAPIVKAMTKRAERLTAEWYERGGPEPS